MKSNDSSKSNQNGIDNQTKGKKSTIEIIKEYLNSQTEQLKKLKNDSKSIYVVIEQFIDMTKNYSSQIELIAMKIIPNYSTEGQLAQAVQGVLLFYSDGLNNLIKDLSKNIVKEKVKKDILDKFNEFKNSYFLRIKSYLKSFENFQNEISLYEEYLVNEEFTKHMMKGDLKNNDDDIVDNNKIKIKYNVDNVTDKKDEKNILKIDNPFSNNGLNTIDNKRELIEKNNLYLSNLKQSNEILVNIKEFLSIEKTNLRKNIFNISVSLIEGLLKCVKSQKGNFDIQNEVIKNLTNNLQYEETDKNEMKPMNYKLKYLEIYESYINGKTSKTQENEISTVRTNKNLNVRRKSLNLVEAIPDKVSRNSISYNTKDKQLSKNQKEEKYKFMITKLSRIEILNIFEKIKKTNIIISENDLQIIEKETIYNKIKEILTMIFINTEKYTENEKNIIINYFEKDKIYIFHFIQILNDHRTKGDYVISEETLKYLGELFKFLNNLVISKNDMELFKFILILSMTYYYKTKDGIQIYLFSYIKDHPDYQKDKFWDEYLQELIEHDLKGSQNQDISNKENNKFSKAQKEKLNNCYFSNFLAAVKAMADFEIDQKSVRNFVERNKNKYVISKEQIENICMVYDMTSNENKTKNNGDFINKENKINNDKKEEKKNIIIENKDIKEDKDINKK